MRINYALWQMAKNGYVDPTIVVREVTLPKPKEKWTEDEMKKMHH